jgi:hypothetical protein
MQLVTADENRIVAESIAVRAQADDLAGWYGSAIKELLPEKRLHLDAQAARLHVACQLRDEAQQSAYQKVEILREQLHRLGGMLLILVLLLLALAIWLPLPLAASPVWENHAKNIAYVATFGGLGGSLSAIQWVIKSSITGSGSEMRSHGPVVYMRPLFGVAAALAVFPFLVAGVVPLELKTNAAVLAVALVAGFTERLIAYAVRTVTPTNVSQSSRADGVRNQQATSEPAVD